MVLKETYSSDFRIFAKSMGWESQYSCSSRHPPLHRNNLLFKYQCYKDTRTHLFFPHKSLHLNKIKIYFRLRDLVMEPSLEQTIFGIIHTYFKSAINPKIRKTTYLA